MSRFVVLLRAINVGTSGRLSMADLKSLCEAAGLHAVRTYIASGNVICDSPLGEDAIRKTLEPRLEAHFGRKVGVVVRTAAALSAVVASNPFADHPGNRVTVTFLDEPATPTMLDEVTGMGPDEAVSLGAREIYARYGSGMARSRLRIPAAARGTARNMTTVAALAALAAG